jgi:hypothetical protein
VKKREMAELVAVKMYAMTNSFGYKKSQKLCLSELVSERDHCFRD